MDAQEFRKDFMENIKAEAAATGEGSCASFVNSFAEYLQEAEVLMDFTASFYQGTGKYNKKYRVDGYAFDEFDKTMSLVIADFNAADEERVLTRTQAAQIQERLSYFMRRISSSASRKRKRGVNLSAGTSFSPSGIQMLQRHGLPCFSPK